MTQETFHTNYLARVKELDLEAKEAELLEQLKQPPKSHQRWLKKYKELLQDTRPFLNPDFAVNANRDDKVADLVQLIKETFPLVAAYGSRADGTALEGFSAATQSRWASGEIRPTQYVIGNLVAGLREDAHKIAFGYLNPEVAQKSEVGTTADKREISNSSTQEPDLSQVSASGITGAFLGASVVALTWMGVAANSNDPDIGVHFHYQDFDGLVKSGQIEAVEAARDLGAIPKTQVEDAIGRAITNWYKGESGTVVIEVPNTPELKDRVYNHNHWCKTDCGGFGFP